MVADGAGDRNGISPNDARCWQQVDGDTKQLDRHLPHNQQSDENPNRQEDILPYIGTLPEVSRRRVGRRGFRR